MGLTANEIRQLSKKHEFEQVYDTVRPLTTSNNPYRICSYKRSRHDKLLDD